MIFLLPEKNFWQPKPLWSPRRKWILPFFGYGYGGGCCCADTADCTVCADPTPTVMRAVITGMQDDSCTHCDSYWNNTFNADFISNCLWSTGNTEIDDLDCNDTWAKLDIYWVSDTVNWWLYVRLQHIHTISTSQQAWFIKEYNSEQDCQLASAETVPWWGRSGAFECDGASTPASAEVTAL